MPYDLPGAVRRFLRRVRPRLAVIFETELWPNLYRECGRRRVPLVLASARISARSVEPLSAPGRALPRHAGAGRRRSRRRAPRMPSASARSGADPASTHVTGNLKFDFELPADIAERGARLRAQYAAPAPLWVAGSTHGGGEEQALLEAQRRVRAQHAGRAAGARAAPPAALCGSRAGAGASRACASCGAPQRRGERSPASCAVLLLDSLGELLDFYAAADVAFVGGSLVPVGGHNLLEPAALGVPILTGPAQFQQRGDRAPAARARRGGSGARRGASSPRVSPQLLARRRERARIGAPGRAWWRATAARSRSCSR